MLLAQYTIRSKQDYIFRTNRIREIVGASINITNAWDILAEEAGKAKIRFQKAGGDETFSLENVVKQFESGELCVVELFRGGGNDTLLFSDEKIYCQLNRLFSYRIARDCPGMVPMVVCVQASDNYKKDYANLKREVDKKKNTVSSGRDNNLVPFAMVDRVTFQPYVDIDYIENTIERVTAEGQSKRLTFKKNVDTNSDTYVRYLDSLATKRDEESLLAVVHADGNNMGRKIQDLLGEASDYDYCVRQMREFTRKTSDVFVNLGLKAMKKCKDDLSKTEDSSINKAFRLIVADGDDMTFICNARYAVKYTEAYVSAMPEEKGYSSCAGICIFHSHYPFARAYEIAEQCCDYAKTRIHGETLKEESWIDYHYIHSGITGDLNAIRVSHGTDKSIARPYRLGGSSADSDSFKCVEKVVDIIKERHIARTSIKTIGSKWEISHADGRKEYVKLCGHNVGLKEALSEVVDDEERLMKIIYDIYEVYDLWFREED